MEQNWEEVAIALRRMVWRVVFEACDIALVRGSMLLRATSIGSKF